MPADKELNRTKTNFREKAAYNIGIILVPASWGRGDGNTGSPRKGRGVQKAQKSTFHAEHAEECTRSTPRNLLFACVLCAFPLRLCVKCIKTVPHFNNRLLLNRAWSPG